MEHTDNLNFELLSDEVKDILTAPPRWIITWGITIVFSIVILIFCFSWFIKYPDVIPAEVNITTQTPPVGINSGMGGRIVRFFVKDNQFVKVNEPLLLFESTTELEDINHLKSMLKTIRNPSDIDKNLMFINFGNLSLGELQPNFEMLNNLINNYKFYLKSNTLANKMSILEQRKEQEKSLIENLQKLKKLKETERNYAQQKYLANKKLHEEKVVAILELNQIESEVFNKDFEINSINSSITKSTIETNEIDGQIADINYNLTNQINETKIKIIEQSNILLAAIYEWEKKYLIVSPIEGNVSLLKIWQTNQMAESGKEIMKILPQSNDLLIKGTVNNSGIGKINVGQDAILKVDAFPYEEYGSLNATVKSISVVPQEDKFFVEFTLKEGLTTSYGKTIILKQEMKASVEIITQKRNLLQRLLDKLTGKLILN